jgi:hypothetical protein
MSARITPSVSKEIQQLMPAWARTIAALFGILLLPLGVIVFVLIRPLDLKSIFLGVGAISAGCDLLGGAISGKWPIMLQWIAAP